MKANRSLKPASATAAGLLAATVLAFAAGTAVAGGAEANHRAISHEAAVDDSAASEALWLKLFLHRAGARPAADAQTPPVAAADCAGGGERYPLRTL